MKSDTPFRSANDLPIDEVRSPNRSRKVLRIAAVVVLLVALVGWAAAGARVGWTQTSVTRMQTDEITGIEYPVRHRTFVPGLELPVAGALFAAGLAGLSLLVRGAHRAS